MKKPISLIIDDGAPLVQVYYYHIENHKTRDGRELLKDIPNDFLFSFCDVAEKHGLKGKLTVLPNPAGQGFISDKIAGHPKEALTEWLNTVNARLKGSFDFAPEMLTHFMTMDLKRGGYLNETELEWSRHATKDEMTDYIAKALEICRDAGIICTGVTSPWNFGEENLQNYTEGIADAFERVFGKRESWFFMRTFEGRDNARSWVELDKENKKVVYICSTIPDYLAGGVEYGESDEKAVAFLADFILTADGKGGKLKEALDRGCYPMLTTHWQSLFSNGNLTGLRALDLVAERIERYYGDSLQWVSCSEQMKIAINDNIKHSLFKEE